MYSGDCKGLAPALQAKRARDSLVYENHPQAFAQNTRDEVRYIGGDGQVTGALAAETGMKQQSYVYENHPNDSRVKGPLDVCEQLTARNGTGGGNLPLVQEAGQYANGGNTSMAVSSKWAKGSGGPAGDETYNMVIEPTAVAFNWQSGGDVRHNPSASVPDALTAHQTPACFLPGQGSKAQGIGYEVGVAPTLRSGCDNYGLHTQMQVRRLTPTECERLQGFPDNFTRIPWRNKTPENCPDGPRYKAIGNSMAIPCVKFIADRIKEQLG
jgi:DNA (cytosine-5)-methyltransferase 1